MTEMKDYDVPGVPPYNFPTWCPGCGNFGIWRALKMALATLDLLPHKVAIVCGIGCSGNFGYWVKTYVLHSLHGRSIPVAQGIKLANDNLPVIVHAGDGDTYGEGLGHLLHAARRNIDITILVHDNEIYGLTTGQPSPTTKKGFKAKVSPQGTIESPINPLTLALSAGATFVGRAFPLDVEHLSDVMAKAIDHKGLSIVDILQPCVTFNNTWKYWKERVYKLEETNHDSSNYEKALEKANEFDSKVPIGVIYQVDMPRFDQTYGTLHKGPLVFEPIDAIDVAPLFDNQV
jgi:2-oxoglutarate/2-oxoacid ferredoxin oxidoreductase subunit beta